MNREMIIWCKQTSVVIVYLDTQNEQEVSQNPCSNCFTEQTNPQNTHTHFYNRQVCLHCNVFLRCWMFLEDLFLNDPGTRSDVLTLASKTMSCNMQLSFLLNAVFSWFDSLYGKAKLKCASVYFYLLGPWLLAQHIFLWIRNAALQVTVVSAWDVLQHSSHCGLSTHTQLLVTTMWLKRNTRYSKHMTVLQ